MTRKIYRGISLSAVALLLVLLFFPLGEIGDGPPPSADAPLGYEDISSPPNRGRDPKPTGGPQWQRQYYERLHAPYGAVLTADQLERIWAEVEAMPQEEPGRDVAPWELVGPSGITVNTQGSLHSGRILDLDAVTGSGLTVAAASGGLWGHHLVVPYEKSKDINNQCIGSFAIHPLDENTIIAGTGEPWICGSTGIWKTTDNGVSWRPIPISPTPEAIFRVRYKSDGSSVHAVAMNGYFRSTDNGETWTRTLVGNTTDLAIVEYDSGEVAIYMTVFDEGLFVSLDEGLHWGQAANPVIPTSDVSRGAITVCDSDPGVIYVAFGEDTGTATVMKGIYKTTNHGGSWTDVSPDFDYMNGAGWYANVISVCPTDPNLVLAGGVWLMRSEDGGASWTKIEEEEYVHGDFHALQWHPNGLYVWAGQDGGWSYSQQQGRPGTWDCSANALPITQYVHMDVKGWNWDTATIGGGSQDNGISISNDGGLTWWQGTGADGGGFNINQWDHDLMWMASGYSNTGLAFTPEISTDGGHTWTPQSLGLPDNETFYPALRLDGDGDAYIYYYCNVYRFHGDTPSPAWLPTAWSPTATEIREMTLTMIPGAPIIYCCTDPTPGEQTQISVLDGGPYMEERSWGLPFGPPVQKVIPHPWDTYRAYALMAAFHTPNQKVYVTEDRGLNWTNRSGNLPNVPMKDMIIFPTDPPQLYLGSEYGFFRSLDDGLTWHRWEWGLPKGVKISEMKSLDLREYGGEFWVVASTYGRSIWKRSINSTDPLSAVDDVPAQEAVVIKAAAPNPFNPATIISFNLASSGPVNAAVFDLRGQRVRHLMDEEMDAGAHDLPWNGTDDRGQSVAAGVYVVRIASRGVEDAIKITLTK